MAKAAVMWAVKSFSGRMWCAFKTKKDARYFLRPECEVIRVRVTEIKPRRRGRDGR